MLLYILLTIIALGVLLASKPGQKLLIFLIISTFILGIVFSLIYITGMGIIFLIDAGSFIYPIYQKYGIIIPILILGFGLYSIYKKCKKDGIKKGLEKIIEIPFPNFKKDLKENKGSLIFVIMAFIFVIFVSIYLTFF